MERTHLAGSPRITEAVNRLKGVFHEIPGTRLTVNDAARLSGLETAMCQVVLEALADAGFLGQKPGGIFVLRQSY